MKVVLNRRHSPQMWVASILEVAKACPGGLVELHLMQATFVRRFNTTAFTVRNLHPRSQPVEQTAESSLANVTYCVTTVPSRDSIRDCAQNSVAGYHPVLFVPAEQIKLAAVLACEVGAEDYLTIISLEDFVAMIVLGLAVDESKDHLDILKEIVGIYNKRLSEVETDLSLLIEVR